MVTRKLIVLRLSLASVLLVGLGCDNLQPESDGRPITKSPALEADADHAAVDASQVGGQPTDEASPTAPLMLGNEVIPVPADEGQPTEQTQAPEGSTPTDQNEYQQRLLGGLEDTSAQQPMELVARLQQIDAAIQDLMSASANNLIDEPTFRDTGLRLGKLKRSAAKQLAEHKDSSEDQRKSGQVAELIALSHLSGFRDVESARELEKYAEELTKSADLDLAHQGRVVLMGFQLQALQNGVSSDPAELLLSAEELFTRPSDRSFPELMILLQASQVLNQMGFEESAQRMDALVVEEFRQASDPKLRNEAWNIETRGSQTLENYMNAFRNLGVESFDATLALAAARQLFREFPSVQTLEQLAGTVVNIEYGGHLGLSRELVDLIEQNLQQFAPSPQTDAIQQTLVSSNKRFAIIGQPLTLDGLVGFDGQPFQMSDYSGKVLLVDFWASWCTPCLNELPEIRRVYEELHDSGFDVVSINMDENLPLAREFVMKRNFPWHTFHASDTSQLGFKATFAKDLGVLAIPFMFLVDSTGIVTDIHVRGERLMPSVRLLLEKRPSLIPQQ